MERLEYHHCHNGAWHNHDFCFPLGPRNVCATQTPFSPTCKDSETNLVLVDNTGKGTYIIFFTSDFTHTIVPLSLCSVS